MGRRGTGQDDDERYAQMNEAAKTYAKREVQQFNGHKVVVTRLVTPSSDQPAIEAGKPKG